MIETLRHNVPFVGTTLVLRREARYREPMGEGPVQPGSVLSASDQGRIEEERLRYKIKQSMAAKRRRKIGWSIATLFFLLFVFWLIGHIMIENASQVGSRHTLIPPVIAREFPAVDRLIRNAENDDSFSNAMMEETGEVFTIGKYDHVRIADTVGHRIKVEVIDGAHIGVQGWVDVLWLK